jgi:hypothetical protein
LEVRDSLAKILFLPGNGARKLVDAPNVDGPVGNPKRRV